MSLSTAEFWRLAIDSGLLSAEDTISLAEKFGKVKGAERTSNAKTLSQWLVGENVLSQYQVRVLLSGHPGQFIFGDYKVYERIPEGHFAGAFKAVHAESQYPVLLKFVEPRLVAAAALWQGTQALGQRIAAIRSPHVRRLFELVDLGQHKFYVFDDRRGKMLADRIAKGPLRPGEACRIAKEVADGLAALHAAGIVHGKVRPQSIWIEKSGRASILIDPLTPAEPIMHGSQTTATDSEVAADYAAPELAAQGAQPTAVSDVYAVGCTLYQMLSGEVPFAGGDIAQKFSRHATERIQPLDQTAGVPQPLAQVVAYSMAKDASLRYAQASALAEALAPYADASSAESSDTENLSAFEEAVAARAKQPGTLVAATPAAASPSPRAVAAVPVAAVPAQSPNVAGAMRAVPASQAPVAAAATATAVDSSAIPIAQPVMQPASTPPEDVEKPEDRKEKIRQTLRRRKIRQSAIIGVALLAVAAVIGYVLTRDVEVPKTPGDEEVAAKDKKDSKKPAASGDDDDDDNVTKKTDNARKGNVADDGRTPWASPTAGDAIQLKYVPGGAHGFLVVRPKSLFSTIDGRRTFDALGPPAEWLKDQVRQATGISMNEIDRLTVAMRGTPSGWPEASLVVEVSSARSDWLEKLGNPTKSEHAGETYYRRGPWSYYLPRDKKGRVLVVTPSGEMQEIIDNRQRPVVLQRLEMRKLLATTDSDQHISLVAEPNFLFGDGRELFAAHASKLIDPLRAYITRDIQAVSLSVFVNDYDFYTELRLVPGTRKNAHTLKQEITDRLETLDDDVEEYVVALNPQQYGRLLIRRLPEMVRELLKNTRTGVEGGQFVANTYLRSSAGHNVLLASELALAESPGQTSAPPTGQPTAKTLTERLKMPLTLVFDQMAFGAVVQELIDQSGAKIVVLGKDLESDGITRNKEIRDFNMEGKSLHEMLMLLCMKNNPVPGIEKASDPNQKLVYVVGPSPDDGKDVILITTRKAAAAKGYKLPPEFGGS